MKKITVKQACMIVICMIISPAVRLFNSNLSVEGSNDGWVGTLIAGALMLALVFVLFAMIKTGRNFSQILQYTLGNTVGRIFMLLYFIWGSMLVAVQMRYSAQRLSSTIYPAIDIEIFVLILTVLCIYGLSKGLTTIARANEIILPITLGVIVLLVVLLGENIKPDELFPIYNTREIFHVALCDFASFSYITLVLFFNDELEMRETFKKHAIISVFIVTLLSLLLFLTVVGSLGPYLMQKLPYPFFSVVKQISIGDFVQHIEAFVITLWILSDFIIVVFLGASMLKLFGALTHKTDTKDFVFPYFFACAALVLYTGRTNTELESISEKIFIPANAIMLFVLPCIFCLIAKIKEKYCAKKRQMLY